MNVLSGLDVLLNSAEAREIASGTLGYLCHSASVDRSLRLGIGGLKTVFGDRLKKVFSPQHGLYSDAQDDMVESPHFVHPYFELQVYSLYAETRSPTDAMLAGLDTLIIDLQDAGSRVYTYMASMTLAMEACGKKDIRVVVLDRPNPIGGVAVEGNVLEPAFTSFVGRHPLPMRHGLTLGEAALMAHRYFAAACDLRVIPMQNWRRAMSFEDTGLPWVLPSPNLATVDAAYTYPGTVLVEGTNLSEGRGTTRSLEIVGHPALRPFAMLNDLERTFAEAGLAGFVLRPLHFLPTFDKHEGRPCGGFQIHVTDRRAFRPWRVGQLLLRELYRELGPDFSWKQPPYEYEYERLPIDLINGTDRLRGWVEQYGDPAAPDALEREGLTEYSDRRENCLLYR